MELRHDVSAIIERVNYLRSNPAIASCVVYECLSYKTVFEAKMMYDELRKAGFGCRRVGCVLHFDLSLNPK